MLIYSFSYKLLILSLFEYLIVTFFEQVGVEQCFLFPCLILYSFIYLLLIGSNFISLNLTTKLSEILIVLFNSYLSFTNKDLISTLGAS